MKPFFMDHTRKTGGKCVGVIWKYNDWWFVADDGTYHSGAAPAAYALAITHTECHIRLTKLNVKYFWTGIKWHYWNVLHKILFKWGLNLHD